MTRLGDIWVYLAASPLLHLALTLIAYLAGDWLYQRAQRHPLLHPVLLAIVMLVGALTVTGTPYATYFEGAQFVHFLLGPATVALAVPLYFNLARLKRLWLPLAAGLLAGGQPRSCRRSRSRGRSVRRIRRCSRSRRNR